MDAVYRTSSYYHTDKAGYIGAVRFYETWKEGDSNPTNAQFKRYLYRLTTDIVRLTPQDAQGDAIILGDEILSR